MAIGDRTPRRDVPDVHLHLPAKAPRVETPEPEKSAMERLFDSLGENDRISVHRITPGEQGEKYLGRLIWEAGLLDNVEETVAMQFGGGRYRLVGRQKDRTVGSAYIWIDEHQFPPKSREQVKAETAPPAPPAPPMDMIALMRFLAERDAQQAARLEQHMQLLMSQQRQGGEGMLVPMMSGMLDTMKTLTMESIRSGAARPAVVESGANPLAIGAQLKSFTEIAEAIGFTRPGAGGAEPVRPLTETLLIRGADKAGDIAGNAINRFIEHEMNKKFGPASASSSQPALPSMTPSAPASSPTVHIPAEAKPLDAATVDRLRAAVRRPSATAPSAPDVLPVDDKR